MAERKYYTIDGFTGTIQELGAHYGINYRTLQTRLRSGWSLAMAVSTPVDKTKSIKLPNVLQVGEYRAVPDVIENRFGVKLNANERLDSVKATEKVRKYKKPEFYEIGSYKGTLSAISQDFKCPLSELKLWMKKGLAVPEILKDGGYLENVQC